MKAQLEWFKEQMRSEKLEEWIRPFSSSFVGKERKINKVKL